MHKTKLILFTLFISLGLFSGFSALPAAEVPSEITTALGKGDVSTLTSYLNDNVELVIDNKNDIFSKQQASNIIAEFFRKNPANGFTALHKGEKEKASFVIGTLKTTKGSYRVYMLTRKVKNKDLIQQLRIEPSNEQR